MTDLHRNGSSYEDWVSSLPDLGTWASEYEQMEEGTALGYLRSLQRVWADPRVEGGAFKARGFMYGLIRSVQTDTLSHLAANLNFYRYPTYIPHTYYLQNWIFNPILSALPEQTRSNLKGLRHCGALPLRSLNAAVLRSPSGEPIIAIDSGLLHLVSYFTEARLIASKFDAQDPEERIYTNRAFRTIVEYYDRGNATEIPLPTVRFSLTERDMVWLGVQNLCLEAFAICHEIAHIALDHLDQPKTHDPSHAEVFHHGFDDEFAADLFGFRLYGRVINEVPIVSKFLEPGFALTKGLELFWLMHLVEHGAGGPKSLTRHPPAKVRLLHLVSRMINEALSDGAPKEELYADPITHRMLQATQMLDALESPDYSIRKYPQ